MQYCSTIYYLFFLPVVVIFYHLFPKGKRWFVLLFASYIFFFSLSRFLFIYLLLSTLSIYYLGSKISKLQQECKIETKKLERSERKQIKEKYKKKQLIYLKGGIFLHIGLLILLKYSSFIGENLNILLHCFNIETLPVLKFMIPIGISFYTLQAVSYITDVYHQKIEADHNFYRLALYMSFFPQLMEGPICRYEQTAYSLFAGEDLQIKNVQFGIQRILLGLIKKLVVADRLNSMIALIFKDYVHYDGGIMVLAMIAYTCQLYMEFSGTMDVVIGSAEIFGIKMPENFNQPFFSRSISEFWTRWHITLGTWFKDYIYYPLSLSKRLRKITKLSRKQVGNYYGPLISGTIALFCVWFCNGVWHGAAWSYIFFGLYHFVLIFLGNVFLPLIQRFYHMIHINKDNKFMILLRTLKTVIFVCVGELFFRAESLGDGLAMFNKMVSELSFDSFSNGLYLNLGMDMKDYMIIFITLFLIFIYSILREKGIDIREVIANKPIVIRWSFYYCLIFYVILFGAYGVGYLPVDPIYAEF